MQLRDYQNKLENDISNAWMSYRNVLAVSPTGSGKTVVVGKILSEHVGASCSIAHRQELVGQISLAMAKFGIKHKIIAPKPLIYEIVQQHVDTVGRSFYNPSSNVAVAGVDTLIRRVDTMKEWMSNVSLWVTDEGHHILRENKWGKVCEMFPNAKGLGVTATPLRADGAGLGRHADGLFDTMVEGSTMRDLINRGYLTDYRIFAPPSDLNVDGVKITGTGEFSPTQLKQRAERSHIVGDVVEHYLRLAPGKVGITFAIDVEEATKIADKFNLAGVPAAVVSAKTPATERNKIINKLRRRELLQVVNVDLFGEGFDLPSIFVVSMARPTHSYGLFVQQFGRALRLMDGKIVAIIIDHVGNVMRHGLPDAPRNWTLDRRERARKNKHDPDLIPMKTCKHCTGLFEAIYKICPYCGGLDVPSERSTPEQVDGDLTELDAKTLAAMRGEIDDQSKIKIPYGASKVVDRSIRIKHFNKIQSQSSLKESIKWFGGYHNSLGIDQSESWKRFYFRFNVDVMTAQTLNTKESNELEQRVRAYLLTVGVNM